MGSGLLTTGDPAAFMMDVGMDQIDIPLFLGTAAAGKLATYAASVALCLYCRPLVRCFQSPRGQTLDKWARHRLPWAHSLLEKGVRTAASRPAPAWMVRLHHDPSRVAVGAAEGLVLFKIVWPVLFPVQLLVLLHVYPPGWTHCIRESFTRTASDSNDC